MSYNSYYPGLLSREIRAQIPTPLLAQLCEMDGTFRIGARCKELDFVESVLSDFAENHSTGKQVRWPFAVSAECEMQKRSRLVLTTLTAPLSYLAWPS